ncbi:unnamed protein product [Allacma fusca]|uniref:Major facilitator superfamily (MFS) profile domain-containing protein n=1 Tax=Allacma fusca TaxID=39272 RepID=A0A8J2JL07_9HEXA|nr:unnamed protein product [Allacma fusca]
MLVEERGERRKRVATPPDGGWGWIVVFASFMIHVIADGVAYSFGLFFVEISKEFKGSKSAASWIGSILFGVTFGAGPIASAFVNRFGCRAVSIAGSVIACFGFGISYWATSFAFLYVSVGLIGGLGLGLIYLPAIVCVSCYFEKKRAFVTGIAVCGSGFGNFLLALVLDPLECLSKDIQQLGWRAALIVVALMLLSCIIFASMFKPLEEPLEDFPNPNYEMENDKRYDSSGNNDSYFMSSTGDLRRHPRKSLPASPAHNDGVNPKGSIEMLPIKYLRDDQDESISSLRRVDSLEEIALKTDSIISENNHEYELATPQRGVITSRKDVFFSGSVSHIPDLIPDERGMNAEEYSRPASSIANYDQQRLSSRRCSGTLKPNCCSRFFSPEFRAGFHTMMDFSLLVDPVFLFFATSNFLTNVGFNVPYIYLADLSKDHLQIHDDKDPSLGYIVSSIGIANTVSRLVLGYFSDKKCVNRLYLYSSSLTICGVATGLAVHGFSLGTLAFCAALFGATGGVYVGLTSVILVDLFGLDKLSNAFGIVLMFQGIGTIFGPPVVGVLFDHFNNYVYGFWLAGITITISGSMLFLIPCIRKHRSNKNHRSHVGYGNSPYAITSDNNRDALIT